MKIIKLENIRPNGEPYEDFICEGCRHLVKPSDETCWQCGTPLEPSRLVEHYHKGKKLTSKEFKGLRTEV